MALEAEGSPLVAGAQAPAAKPATVRVQVVSQFRLPGSEDPMPGDVLELPPSLAAELQMYGRVQRVAEAAAPAPKPAKGK